MNSTLFQKYMGEDKVSTQRDFVGVDDCVEP